MIKFQGDGVGEEKERFDRSNRKSGDESITGQKQKFEWDLSYHRNSWYMLVYIKDLCCRHCFLQLQWM